jgi:hypothetical protein
LPKKDYANGGVNISIHAQYCLLSPFSLLAKEMRFIFLLLCIQIVQFVNNPLESIYQIGE